MILNRDVFIYKYKVYISNDYYFALHKKEDVPINFNIMSYLLYLNIFLHKIWKIDIAFPVFFIHVLFLNFDIMVKFRCKMYIGRFYLS